MSNKILVLGEGFLGEEFKRHGIETWGKDKFNINYPNSSISGNSIDELKNYDVVVNCIGKSNTRWCEDRNNFKEALFVNGKLPGILSQFCNNNGIRFVHISTGCLYDDTSKENTEDSFISAHCNYTTTKWVGELTCNVDTDIILRPRLYFSDVAHKNNLLGKLPNFSSFTGDKMDSLTCTSTIVGATKAILEAEDTGIFNVAQVGSATIAQVAQWCGLPINGVNTADQLREREGLYLVNNVMNIDRLMKYYKPMDIETSVRLSYAELIK